MEERTTELRRGPPPPPPPWYREHWWIYLVALLLIVGLIIAFFALRGDGDDDETVQTAPQQRSTVPNLIGLQERFARNVLEERGFEVEVVREPSVQRRGVVVEQDPGAGSRLARGGQVSITVSTGPEPTQTVTQTVTPGPETKEMPDLVGTAYPDAVEDLVDVGLFPDSFPVESADERGNVVGQRPDPGAEVTDGSSVRLDVSLGSGEREDGEVPDLTGQSLADALRACAEAGFTCRIVTGAEEGREVAEQRPAAGDTAPELSQIALSAG
jgi:eukaryotic-like serine/threonine-protein kinase